MDAVRRAVAESESRAALVREKLLVDRNAAFAEVVEQSRPLLRLDESGGIHPNREALSRMGGRQKLELFLLGRYLGKAGSLVETDSASDAEMAEFLGMKVQEVQKRAHDLKSMGRIAAVEPGVYRLTEGRVSEVLRDLGTERE